MDRVRKGCFSISENLMFSEVNGLVLFGGYEKCCSSLKGFDISA